MSMFHHLRHIFYLFKDNLYLRNKSKYIKDRSWRVPSYYLRASLRIIYYNPLIIPIEIQQKYTYAVGLLGLYN